MKISDDNACYRYWDCFVAMLLAKTSSIKTKESFDFEPGGVLTTFDLVEVDLGDGKAGMGEEAGDGLEVVAGFFAEHGSGVAQSVDGDTLRVQTGKADIFLEQATDHPGG